MIRTGREVYEWETAPEQWSDIKEHLPRLREVARGQVLEIGTRDGVSTGALLAGVEEHGGHVTSLDIVDCSRLFAGHPQWTFVRADSKLFPPMGVELLFIDGDHSFRGVLGDLERFAPHAQHVLLHDTDAADWPGVREAVEMFTSMRPEWEVTYREGSYGMGELRRR